jgi:GR25 family glycosyltransferase involved in LPS biosynthesis
MFPFQYIQINIGVRIKVRIKLRIKMIPGYVISMKYPDELLNSLPKYNIDATWIKGVNGKDLKQQDINERATTLWSYFGPRSAIGCAFAHMNAWKALLQSSSQYAVIVEEDVYLEDDFNDQLNLVLSHTPSNFDVLYLGCIACEREETVYTKIFKLMGIARDFKYVNDYVEQPSIAMATHCYVISRKGAEKLLHELDGKLFNHVDFCMQSLAKKNVIESYAAVKKIGFQTSTTDSSKSLNTSNFPLLLNKLLSHIRVAESVSLDYTMNISLFRIGPFNVNLISILFLFIGIVAKLYKVNIKTLLVGFFLASSPDIYVGTSSSIIVFNMLLLIFPTLFPTLLTYTAKPPPSG